MSWLKKNTKTERKASAPAPASQGGQAGMDQMVRMLAAAPEDRRTMMLGDRLAVFAGQDEASRERAMKGMLAAALQLPEDGYRKIAASRFKALNGLDADTRMTLMKSHAAVVKSLPADQQQREMKTMKQIVSALPEAERGRMMAMMQNLGLMGEAG
ncbi:MAG: hypothetical protein GXP34_06245 [Actinobacteria bacterium]|nr:hypothetical protein [Actinomycetota bacterium]